MLRTFPKAQRRTNYFHCFYFPKSRKSEFMSYMEPECNLCKILLFQHIRIVYGPDNTFYIAPVQFINVKTNNHCTVLSPGWYFGVLYKCSCIRGGSTLRPNPLPFYIPLFTKKVPLSYIFY